MRGLILKDILLMKNYRNSFILMLAMAVGISIFIDDYNFSVYVISVFGMISCTSSFTYDEMDRWDYFVLSTPVSRRDIVRAKYISCTIIISLLIVICSALSALVSFLGNEREYMEIIMSSLATGVVTMMLVACSIPFSYKFGVMGGRIAIITVGGVIFTAFLGAVTISNASGELHLITDVNVFMAISTVVFVATTVIALSYFIAVYFFSKKEY